MVTGDGTVRPHEVSIVVPVYKGELTLNPLLAEIEPLTFHALSPGGRPWLVAEVLLVFDNGPDDSSGTMRALAERYPFVRTVWLSRNFGQHSATLAGMASSGSEWIATIDEDQQHSPDDIGKLLDVALDAQVPLVYGKPTNKPSHGWFRNLASRSAKGLVSRLVSDRSALEYQSFRLVVGEVGRSVAAYAGAGVYLDIALGWIVSKTATADIQLRGQETRASGYSTRSLIAHFWRLVLSSGTRGLRVVSLLGVVSALAGIGIAIYFVIERLLGGDLPAGWASTVTIMLVSTGLILISLGVIAEYLGVAVNMAMGRPPYLIVTDPRNGPLGRPQSLPEK